MKIQEKVSIATNNCQLIEKQMKEGNHLAANVAHMYAMNQEHTEHCSLALFECAFDDWYKVYKDIITRG